MPPPSTAKMKSTSAIKPRQTMRGHTSLVPHVVHLCDGRRIITCSIDGSLRLWNLESGVQIGNDWRDDGDEAEVRSIALSPNGKTVASGSRDGTVRLWDVETKKVVARWTGHTDAVRSLCWSVDGERVVSGSDDGTIRVWDVESGDTVLGPIKTGHEYVYAAIYSPDTTKIATGGDYETALKIWDAKTGNLLSTIKHESTIVSLAWTTDQKKIITGSDVSIRIFDTATWQHIAILEGHTSIVFSLSQHGRLLASGSADKTVRLWNLDTNLAVSPPIQHEDIVRDAAISADGTLLVTGCDDKNAYAWDIHTTLKDAGLEDLLSIHDVPPDGLKQKVTVRKSLMDTNATRRPAKREHPDGWRKVDKLICWMTIGETNLENFWVHVREKGWEKANERLRDAVTQITTAQGLILVVCAAFFTITPPVETIDYARRRCYIWLLWSFMCSVWGLICQLMFLRINMSLSIQDTPLEHSPLSRSAVELYIVIFSLPHYAFLLSLLFLASGIMEAILGGPIDIIFFCLALCAGVILRIIGDFVIENTLEANIKLISRFAALASLVVLAIGLVCSVH